MRVHLLSRPIDRVLLRVQQVLHELDQLHFAPLVHAVPRPVFGGIQEAELTFPVTEDVRLQVCQLADLANGEELLHRIVTHWSCSARSSRAISSFIA